MTERTRGYAHRVDVVAPQAEVWRGLIEPERIALWYAPGARVRACAGGSYAVRADRDLDREAHIDVFQPPRRLRLIYMPLAGYPRTDAVIVDDFIVDSGEDGAVVRLLGSGIPEGPAWEPLYLRLRDGWARALARLKFVTEKRVEEAGTR